MRTAGGMVALYPVGLREVFKGPCGMAGPVMEAAQFEEHALLHAWGCHGPGNRGQLFDSAVDIPGSSLQAGCNPVCDSMGGVLFQGLIHHRLRLCEVVGVFIEVGKARQRLGGIRGQFPGRLIGVDCLVVPAQTFERAPEDNADFCELRCGVTDLARQLLAARRVPEFQPRGGQNRRASDMPTVEGQSGIRQGHRIFSVATREIGPGHIAVQVRRLRPGLQRGLETCAHRFMIATVGIACYKIAPAFRVFRFEPGGGLPGFARAGGLPGGLQNIAEQKEGPCDFRVRRPEPAGRPRPPIGTRPAQPEG